MEKIDNYQILLKNEFENIFYNYKPTVDHIYLPIYYALDSGKKLRASSVLLSSEVFGEINRNAIVCAVAAEMFHNFTLLHDDVMDKSLLRRNKPTVQAKWGVNQAILTGDAMLILVYQKLLELTPDVYFKVLEVVNKTALEVCEGQQLDMDFESIEIVSTLEYNTMIKLKTAVLLAASLSIGAIVAKTSDYNINQIYEFGLNLGLAFQIQDDYFDTFGDTNTFGKKVGNDIITNKKTFLYTTALERASQNHKNELLLLYKNNDIDHDEKISRVVEIFKIYEVDKMAIETTNEYFQKSIKCLENLNDVDLQKKQLFYSYAQMIINRKK